jgi:hypothetical protein
MLISFQKILCYLPRYYSCIYLTLPNLALDNRKQVLKDSLLFKGFVLYFHNILKTQSSKYEDNSVSKLQIQVATYVFELSAENCHR